MSATSKQLVETRRYMTDASSKQAVLLKRMGLTPEIYLRALENVLIRFPAIAECTRDSIYQAVYKSCEAGLLPDGRQAAIVPLKKGGTTTAEFWPMVYGLMTLVRENIPGIVFNVDAVYEGDDWQDERGSKPLLRHVPNPDTLPGTNPAEGLVAVYATAHMPGNEVPEVVVIYRAELAKFKKNNRGPWATHPIEMFKVRAFKRLLKRLPITPKFAATTGQFLEEDDDSWQGETLEQVAAEVEQPAPAAAPKAQTRTRAAPKAQAPVEVVPPPNEPEVLVQDEPGAIEPDESAPQDMF